MSSNLAKLEDNPNLSYYPIIAAACSVPVPVNKQLFEASNKIAGTSFSHEESSNFFYVSVMTRIENIATKASYYLISHYWENMDHVTTPHYEELALPAEDKENIKSYFNLPRCIFAKEETDVLLYENKNSDLETIYNILREWLEDPNKTEYNFKQE